MQTVKVAGVALQVRALTSADRQSMLALHDAVFDSKADADWYDWKYGQAASQGNGRGSAAWDGEAMVAHCGGIPRTLWVMGQRMKGLQIGDVMVSPPWRGVLTRHGPFYHASQHFYHHQIGEKQPFQLGYGFPSERHLRLAMAVQLLNDGGAVHALHWDTANAPGLASWAWCWTPMEAASADFDATINHAWQAMQAHAADLTLGQRDSAYMRWRYLNRPNRQHHFFVLRRPWSRKPSGVVVMNLEPSGAAHWLDWVGPPALAATACRACCNEAARHGKHQLEMWATSAVLQELAGSGIAHQSVVVRLGIVRNSVLDKDRSAALRWWLMGGDTDFL